MGKVIIGVHGLANKSPAKTLSLWWEKAITEGLEKNIKTDKKFNFIMTYWANYLYKYPLHSDSDFSFDQLYNSEPYVPSDEGLKEYEDGLLDDLYSWNRGIIGNVTDFMKDRLNVNGIADMLLRKHLKDLAYYYSNTQMLKNAQGKKVLARELLRGLLRSELEKNAKKEIMLITHSMGSIIAYDVLREMEKDGKSFKISHFVTIGSPLGLPFVIDKIKREFKNTKTPENIEKSWINFADIKDVVAIDFRLSDDYTANKASIKPKDDLVYNDYHIGENYNHHKSYGYLRAPEVSRHINSFL